jgi:hypothetical protein
MQCLAPLGGLKRRPKRTGDVGGDGVAAERDAVGMEEVPVGKHLKRGGAGAEIDARHAELGLVGRDH